MVSDQQQSFDQFLLWEQTTRDTIDFKTIYVDMADDLIAGLMLSQIVFWHLPDAQGRSKLRVHKDGYLWIARGRADWYDEIRVTAKQADRALGILEKRGIIATALYKFDGAPTKHIRIDSEGFLSAWRSVLQERGKSIFTKGENPNLPKVEMDVDERDNSLTETTSETTAEGDSVPAPTDSPSENQDQEPEHDPYFEPAYVYKEETSDKLPSHYWADRVCTTVGIEQDDLQFWRNVIRAWIGKGWRKDNVSGMLEYYAERRLPGEKGPPAPAVRGQNGGAGAAASASPEPTVIYGLHAEPDYL